MNNNLETVAKYYEAMGQKDMAAIERYLHPEVHLISPLAEVKGKQAVLNSVKHFMEVFNGLNVRACCGNGDQAMLAYDLDCPQPIGLYRGAVLLTFRDGLIIQYELLYDTRPILQRKDEIFT